MRTNVVPILEAYGVDLVLCGHSHNYERSYLLNGHYGFSQTLEAAMVKDGGSGRTNDTGAYLKSSVGPSPNDGAVYVVAGSSGWTTSLQPKHHPAMYITLLRMGSMVIDIDGNRLEARFLRETGEVDDYFTITKGAPAEPLRLAVFRVIDDEVVARWKSIAGKTYQVELATSLQTPDWSAVSDVLTAGGATTSWTNAAPRGTEAFYRVVELIP